MNITIRLPEALKKPLATAARHNQESIEAFVILATLGRLQTALQEVAEEKPIRFWLGGWYLVSRDGHVEKLVPAEVTQAENQEVVAIVDEVIATAKVDLAAS